MPRRKKEKKKTYNEVFKYLSSIRNNDDYMDAALSYLKENNLIKEYVLYSVRRDVAQEIVNATCYTDGVFKRDMANVEVYSRSVEAILYLDLEWPENIDYIANYDLCHTLRIDEILNLNDSNNILHLCELLIKDIEHNDFSTMAMVREFLSNLDLPNSEDFIDAVNNPEFISLLSNQLISSNDQKEK